MQILQDVHKKIMELFWRQPQKKEKVQTWTNSTTADAKKGNCLDWCGKEQGVHLLMMWMMKTRVEMRIMATN